MSETTEFGSPDVHLRAIEPEDLDLLYTIENDPHMWDVGITNVPYSRYLLHNYIASTVGDIYTDRQLRLIIESKEGDALGIVDLTNFDPRHMRAELGIVVRKEYRNRGVASVATSTILHYVDHILHLHQLYAVVDTSNTVSIDFFKSFGFQLSATLPHWLQGSDGYHDAVLMQYFLQKNI